MVRETLSNAITLYIVAILVVIVASWIPSVRVVDALRVLVDGCDALTRPYLGLWRRVIPPIGVGGMGLDISPLVAVVVLSLGGGLLVGLIPV